MAFDFDKLFAGFSQLKVMVVGDVMLDTYLWGNVERISPEAPVPVVTLRKKDHRLGGAANVALNIRSLGAEVAMFSIIGNDDDAGILRKRFLEEQISDEWLIGSGTRITTNKSRVISRNQQMLRMDAEITDDLSGSDETKLIESIEKYIKEASPQVLIFEDYNKGVLTERVIASVIELCTRHKVITTVDPKRRNFFSYKGVTIFKPNLKEVTEAFNLLHAEVTAPALSEIHERLHQRLQHTISFITLSEKGVFYNNTTTPVIIPSHIRNIADVSGAGDTVIAVASLIYAATGNVHLMAEIANLAGGLVCEEVGTAAINKQQLLEECKLLLK
ncbi:MAG: carbohydrate kinase [Chitinophagaceae bacterium]|nr:carbohydrate kinase [Chitinophagaceae bacterium]